MIREAMNRREFLSMGLLAVPPGELVGQDGRSYPLMKYRFSRPLGMGLMAEKLTLVVRKDGTIMFLGDEPAYGIREIVYIERVPPWLAQKK